MRTHRSRLSALLFAAVAGLLLGAEAHALSLRADFVRTTHRVTAGEDYADLAAAFAAGTPLNSITLTSFQNVSAQVSAGVSRDYGIRLVLDLTPAAPGLYTFQAGADWGRGGVAAVIDQATGSVVQEYVRTDDIWWANDWNNADVFTTQVALTSQAYTLVWLGFEDCCAGVTTLRFSYAGSPYQVLNELNLAPLVVPEPRAAVLLALGLASLRALRPAAARGRVGAPRR